MNATEMAEIGRALQRVSDWYNRIAKLQRKWGPVQQIILYPCRFCHRHQIDEWYSARLKGNLEQTVAEVESLDEARDLYRGILQFREAHYIRETGNYTAKVGMSNFVVSHIYCTCRHCQRTSTCKA